MPSVGLMTFHGLIPPSKGHLFAHANAQSKDGDDAGVRLFILRGCVHLTHNNGVVWQIISISIGKSVGISSSRIQVWVHSPLLLAVQHL